MTRIRIGAAAWTAAVVLGLFSLAMAVSMDEKKDGDGDGKGEDRAAELYRAGNRFAQEGRWEDALARFEQADHERADDPEILNMLAFCLRKTGRLDAAFEHYRRALELRPEFPQAREYLGEAHLQAALAELAVLRGYGDAAKEEARMLADALRRAAAEADGGEGDETRNGEAKKPGRRW